MCPLKSTLYYIALCVLLLGTTHREIIARGDRARFLGDCSVATDNTALAGGTDADSDGITGTCEQTLAEKFAPVIYHSSDESNYPTNVDWFLQRTALFFYTQVRPDLTRKLIERPSQAQLLGNGQSDGATPASTIRSDGTRSSQKLVTFFLEDVPENARGGSRDTTLWTTYFHSYVTEDDGITIQFWRFYAYNDAANNHGGDWEGIHVVLDKNVNPMRVGLLGHRELEYLPWSAVRKEGNHPVVFSEGGGHATRASGDGIHANGCGGGFLNSLFCNIDLNKPATYVRQETWTNGRVQWFNGGTGTTGRLLNIGEKIRPMNGQVFIQYSGLWGSPSQFPSSPTYFSFSGYWGPTFNETSLQSNNFITAWCAGMSPANREECFPSSVSP